MKSTKCVIYSDLENEIRPNVANAGFELIKARQNCRTHLKCMQSLSFKLKVLSKQTKADSFVIEFALP